MMPYSACLGGGLEAVFTMNRLHSAFTHMLVYRGDSIELAGTR